MSYWVYKHNIQNQLILTIRNRMKPCRQESTDIIMAGEKATNRPIPKKVTG